MTSGGPAHDIRYLPRRAQWRILSSIDRYMRLSTYSIHHEPSVWGRSMNDKLEQEVGQMHAEICAGLADPNRILILYALADGRHSVTHLALVLHLSQPLTSR